MGSTDRDARVAGFLYLLLTLLGLFALEYVPSALFVTGNAAATAHNIVTHEMLFRLAIVSELAAIVLELFVALALYRLFKSVDRTQALLLVILGGLIPVPLYFLNALNYVAALILVRGADFLAIFSAPQRDALAMLFLRLHHYELLASFIFAGLWLFPFGILVFKSGFLPRILGIWLVVNGLAYLVITVTGFLLPQYSDAVGNVTSPILFGEIAIMLWLLVMGARQKRPEIMATNARQRFDQP
jgi:hypothetical protein